MNSEMKWKEIWLSKNVQMTMLCRLVPVLLYAKNDFGVNMSI